MRKIQIWKNQNYEFFTVEFMNLRTLTSAIKVNIKIYSKKASGKRKERKSLDFKSDELNS